MAATLAGKVALVTGGSRGIGRAIAEAYVAAGATVLIVSRKPDDLARAAGEIGAGVHWYAANAGEPDQVRAAVAHCVAELGGLDVLVSNAATNPHFGRAVDIDVERFDKTVAVNFRGPLLWARAAWTAAMEERGGAIVNVASLGAFIVEPGIGVYNATKAATVHLTRTLASELAPAVRVNAIAPGLVRTDMARAIIGQGEERIAARIPLRRVGEPADIARAALFLASDEASWITGQTLVVDGGISVR